MNTLTAGLLGMMNRDMEPMVFDWDYAARWISIILDKTTDKDIYFEAALRGDEENTWGVLYKHGSINENPELAYLCSTWAKPMLTIYTTDEKVKDYISSQLASTHVWTIEEEDDESWKISRPMWIEQWATDEWDAKTWWPESAREILETGRF